MAHGEHAADTASWVELSQDLDTAPAWLIQLWSSGAWAGPRLFLVTLANYTGRVSLGRGYQRFEELFWNGGGKSSLQRKNGWTLASWARTSSGTPQPDIRRIPTHNQTNE